MLLGVILAGVLLRPYFRKTFEELISESGASAGLLTLIVGAGGSFGAIINGSGIATALVGWLSSMNMSLLMLGFVLTAILRAAQGSATVAAVTTSSIVAPMIAGRAQTPLRSDWQSAAVACVVRFPMIQAFGSFPFFGHDRSTNLAGLDPGKYAEWICWHGSYPID